MPPWVKLWSDLLRDLTIQRWPPGQRWCWVGVLLVAGESREPGVLVDDSGLPIDDAHLAALVCVSRATLRDFRRRALAAGKLHVREDGALVVTNYTKRQSRTNAAMSENGRESVGNLSLSDTPHGATRVREDGQRQKTEAESSLQAAVVRPAGSLPSAITRDELLESISEQLTDADTKTATVLRHVAKGLPEAALRTAVESLDIRRSRQPRLASESRYLVATLQRMKAEGQYS